MCLVIRQPKITNRHRIDAVGEIMAVDDAMLLHNIIGDRDGEQVPMASRLNT